MERSITPPHYSRHIQQRVSIIDPTRHTMEAGVLKRYVTTKFTDEQRKCMEQAIEAEARFEVHGIYHGHAEQVLSRVSLAPEHTYRRESRPGKEFCNIRPTLLDCSKQSCLVLVVFPSPEFVDQYAELLALQLHYLAPSKFPVDESPVLSFHYPDAENSLAKWTQLDQHLGEHVLPGDICVLGYVSEISSELRTLDFADASQGFTRFGLDNMYGVMKHVNRRTNRRILLLGACNSYWGRASAEIAGALARAGAGHIIYAAKAGTLIDSELIHKTLCPSEYKIVRPKESSPELDLVDLSKAESSLREEHLGLVKHLSSGIHITVPTVVGETVKQRDRYRLNRPATIDNESGHIVQKLQELKEHTGTRTEFTGVFFVTDYVHDNNSAAPRDEGNDLSHKGGAVDAARAAYVASVAAMINNYAYHRGAPDRDAEGGLAEAFSNWDSVRKRIDLLASGRLEFTNPRDGALFLDAYVVAAYYSHVPLVNERVAKALNFTMDPLTRSALFWVQLACKYHDTKIDTRNSALQGPLKALKGTRATRKKAENEFKRAREAIERTETTLQQINARCSTEITSLERQQNPFAKFLQALYLNLLGSSLRRLSLLQPNPENARRIALMQFVRAHRIAGTCTARDRATIAYWDAIVRNMIAMTLSDLGNLDDARDHFLHVMKSWESQIASVAGDTSSMAARAYRGELALARIHWMEKFDRKPSWIEDVQQYVTDTAAVPFIVATVRAALKRVASSASSAGASAPANRRRRQTRNS